MTGVAPDPYPLVRVKAYAEIEITVDVDFATDVGYSADVERAVQDAIGHTGAKVEDVTEWETVPR